MLYQNSPGGLSMNVYMLMVYGISVVSFSFSSLFKLCCVSFSLGFIYFLSLSLGLSYTGSGVLGLRFFFSFSVSKWASVSVFCFITLTLLAQYIQNFY